MHVRPRGRLRAVARGQDVFVEQELGVTRFHGGGGVAEDGAGEGVGPVVEDVVEEVGAGACGKGFSPCVAGVDLSVCADCMFICVYLE